MGTLGNTNEGSVGQGIEEYALGGDAYVAPEDGIFTKLVAHIRHDAHSSNPIHHTHIWTGAIYDLNTNQKVAECVPESVDTQTWFSKKVALPLKQEAPMILGHRYLLMVGAQRYGYQFYVYTQNISGLPAEERLYTMMLVDGETQGEPIVYDIRKGFPPVYGQGAVWGRRLDYSLKACIYAEYRTVSEPPPQPPPPQLRAITIMPYAGGSSDPAKGTYSWYDGEQHLITAIPANGYDVNYWTLNDVVITTPDPVHYWLTVQGDAAVSIHFKPGAAPPPPQPPPPPPPPPPTPTPACPIWMNTLHSFAVKRGLKRLQQQLETLAANKKCSLT